ncbi:hypothetical protein G4B88_002582 [Cannabis sativa]|uniref:Transposase Tnp1/En/Spm-like domain-containing protein n=1 Tax=Cannabis sativa TaxID=3483 RepID=A0A7J6I9P5_CANSA|nr:hypothetical protein G4B88_002582 [Cannabis sativa]
MEQEKFDIPLNAKIWTFRLFDHLSFEEQKKCKDKRVYSDQWEELIKYWATDNAKRKSAKNKSSRAKKEYNHTTGRKSFAQLRALQKPDGASTPTRATMLKICYAKKKKSVISEKTKEAMLQLQEKQQLNEDASKEKTMNDTFSEVMGREKHGSVRMYGFGAIHHSDKATSSHLDTNVNTALAKETRSQWFSSSQYDTPIIEVGELVNIKSVTSEPETIVIGITIGQVVGASIAWPTTFLIPLASDKPFYDSMV